MAVFMKMKYLYLIFLILAILLSSCRQPAPATPTLDTVATIVAATMQALTPQVVLDTPTSNLALPDPTTTLTPITASTSSMETNTPTVTATPGAGIVSGGVYGYPYGALPRLIIVAFNEDHLHWNYMINVAGASYYSIDLVEGKYQIVAYDASGHAGGCITIVTVKDKEIATCDITDWTGSYPLKPDEAPNP